MGDNLTKLTFGTVGRNVQYLTAGTGIDISATGVVSVDADDFYTKTEVDTLLDDYYTKTEVDTELAAYYTKTEVDAELDDKVDKVTGKGLSTNDYTTADKTIVSNVTTNLDNKVDKVSGKGLSTNDYTTAEKTKLAGIADGAEVNVQSDWNQTSASADDFIKNKPTIPDVSDFYTKTQVDTALGNKVDKVTGKGLSANDYTNADKAIVDSVTTDLAGKVDKVTGKGLSANDYTNADKAIVDAVTTNLANKQDKLTAGTNVTISGNTISATDTTYTAGTGLALSGTEFSANLGYTTSGLNRAVKADSNGKLYITQKDDGAEYTAGTNIQISSSNVISATDTTYTAGDKIAISSGNVISLNLTKADILTILGYKEATIEMTDINGNTATETVLVKQ